MHTRRSPVDIDAAQAWYARTACAPPCERSSRSRKIPLQFDLFVSAVVSELVGSSRCHGFPSIFYLDQDRLDLIQAEIEDLVHVEACMHTFADFLKQLDHKPGVAATSRQQLQNHLRAIMGNSTVFGSSQWIANSKALSLEILRQAVQLSGQTISYSHDASSKANQRLLQRFAKCGAHVLSLKETLLEKVLMCTNQYYHSTPTDWFNNLVPTTGTVREHRGSRFPHLHVCSTSPNDHLLENEALTWQNLTNRLAHIILLHWRVWGRIAYVQDGCSVQSSFSLVQNAPTSSHSVHSTVESPQLSQQNPKLVAVRETGESLETGQETLLPHETSSQ